MTDGCQGHAASLVLDRAVCLSGLPVSRPLLMHINELDPVRGLALTLHYQTSSFFTKLRKKLHTCTFNNITLLDTNKLRLRHIIR